MKLPAILIVSVAVVAGILAVVLLRSGDGVDYTNFDPGVLASVSESRQETVLEGYLTNQKMDSAQKVEFLKWMFENSAEAGSNLIREHGLSQGNLPEQLSRACFELLQEQKTDAAVTILDLGRELYPNDPSMLGVTGVAAYLAGRQDEAYQLLSQSETWRRDIPMVDFYLGGLLLESEVAANRARGKALLVRVAESQSEDFSELAGLMVLSNTGIPLNSREFKDLYETLMESNTFRIDNTALNVAILRILVGRAIRFYPEAGLELADLLIQYPKATDRDLLVSAQLAQNLGQVERATEYLSALGDTGPEEGSPEAGFSARIRATQFMLTGEYEKGLEAFEGLISSNPADPNLPGIFQIVLRTKLPMSIEEAFLNLLLELEAADVDSQLAGLQRLTEIDPLREEKWLTYAAENLLQKEPENVGAWMIRNGGAEMVVAGLSQKAGLSEDACRILVEAYLNEGRHELALQTLAQFPDTLTSAMHAYLSARAYLIGGDTDMAYEKWHEAYNQALSSDAFPMMKNLGILAVQLDQPMTALQCLYASLTAGIPFTENQAQGLLDLTLKYGNLGQSIKVASYLKENFPDKPVHKNNLAYFKFLAEEDLDTQVEFMRELSEEYPEIQNYRLTLALGLLKIGRQNEASRLIQNTSINWGEAGNRAQLIYAVILGATNQRVVAEGLMQNIDMDALIPEEKALLEAM